MNKPVGENPRPIQELSIEEIAAAETALALFTREHWDEPVPVLDEAAQTAIKSLFNQRNMRIEFGSRPINPEGQLAIGVVLGHDPDGKTLLDKNPKAVVGPYFQDGQYYPEGVSVWTPIVESYGSKTINL